MKSGGTLLSINKRGMCVSVIESLNLRPDCNIVIDAMHVINKINPKSLKNDLAKEFPNCTFKG